MRRIFRITTASLALALALALRVSSPASAIGLPACQLPSTMTNLSTAMQGFLVGMNTPGPWFSGGGQIFATINQTMNQFNEAMMQSCSLQSNVGDSGTGGLMSQTLSPTNVAALQNMSTQVKNQLSTPSTNPQALQAESVTAGAVIASVPSTTQSINECMTASGATLHGATEAAQVNGACTSVVAQQVQQSNLLTAAQIKQKQADAAKQQADETEAEQIQQGVMANGYGSTGAGLSF